MTQLQKDAIEPLPMNCAEFQQKLPELFESGGNLAEERHLQSCENCSALVRDLQYIAQQARLLLPIHDPSPTVWEKIQSALKKECSDAS